MKRILSVFAVLSAVTAFAAPTIDRVAVRQQWPWSTDLKVDFSLTGVESPADVFVSYFSGNTLLLPDGTGATNGNQAATVGLTGIATGGEKAFAVPVANRFAGFGKEVPDFRVELEAVDAESGKYLVIDLSAGKDAAYWPHFFTNEMSDAVLAGDACRTTQLWLRRIPKGTFECGIPDGTGDQPIRAHHGTKVFGGYYYYPGTYQLADHRAGQVTLTEDYYIAVFELTQKQCQLICGNAHAHSTATADASPAGLSWNDVRGADVDATSVSHWPTSRVATVGSILGKLRVKTGFCGFDLPTNAQWERAARGNATGHTALPDGESDGVWATGMTDTALTSIAHCNADAVARVGSLKANAFGLYDVIGNVAEWVLDAWADYNANRDLAASAGTDPVGTVGGSFNGYWFHIAKGGKYNDGKSGGYPNISNEEVGYQAFLTIYNKVRNTANAVSYGARLVLNLHPYAKD